MVTLALLLLLTLTITTAVVAGYFAWVAHRDWADMRPVERDAARWIITAITLVALLFGGIALRIGGGPL